MKNGKLYYFLKIFLCFVFLQSYVLAQDANSTSSNNPADGEITKPQVSEENLIHFGDLIEVDVVGSFEYDWRYTTEFILLVARGNNYAD